MFPLLRVRLRAAVNQSLAQRKEAEMKVIIPALALLQIAAGRKTHGGAGGHGLKNCVQILSNLSARTVSPSKIDLRN